MSEDGIWGPFAQLVFLLVLGLVMIMTSMAALHAASLAAHMGGGPTCGVHGCTELASR